MSDLELDDVEPTVTLQSGDVVLESIQGLVRELRATGYEIHVDPSAADDEPVVAVTPRVHEDTWFSLESNWDQVAAILAADVAERPWDGVERRAQSRGASM